MSIVSVETTRIRPAELNHDVTEGDAWTVAVVLRRGGVPIDLTGALIVTRFKAKGSDVEVAMAYAPTNLAAGTIALGQAAGASGNYAVVVTEAGANARTMLKGYIDAERAV